MCGAVLAELCPPDARARRKWKWSVDYFAFWRRDKLDYQCSVIRIIPAQTLFFSWKWVLLRKDKDSRSSYGEETITWILLIPLPEKRQSWRPATWYLIPGRSSFARDKFLWIQMQRVDAKVTPARIFYRTTIVWSDRKEWAVVFLGIWFVLSCDRSDELWSLCHERITSAFARQMAKAH